MCHGLIVVRWLSTIYEKGCRPCFFFSCRGVREVDFELFGVSERQVLKGKEEGFWALFVNVSSDL